MSTKHMHYIGRGVAFAVGLLFMALGVTLTVRADLGTTAISSLPYVASMGFGVSIGMFTVLLNSALVVVQFLILRDKFPKSQFLQVPASFLFGFLIDFWMSLVPDFSGFSYGHRFFFLTGATLVLALGVFMVVRANVVVMAVEGLAMVLSLVSHRDFGTMKTAVDTTMVISAALLSLILFHELRGVREGTILSAVFVGVLLKLFNSGWGRMTKSRHVGKSQVS